MFVFLRRLWRQSYLTGFVLLIGAVASRGQTEVTLAPSKDNTLFEDISGTLSSGAGQYIFVGPTVSHGVRRALLAFNVAGSIPPNSTITNVALTLNLSQAHGNAINVSIHRVLADWGEGTSNSGFGGAGAPATPGDATWTRRFFNTVSWLIPGGDFAATPSATKLVDTLGVHTWNSTSALVSDVQGWVNNPSTNFGWILVGNESTPGDAKKFDSREQTTVANRPRLVVRFIPPTGVDEPGARPDGFFLSQNYPNPFNPATRIPFSVRGSGFVTLKVFDILGREVAILLNENLQAGNYDVTFDATGLASGTYFYRLQAGEFSQTKRLLLLR